MANEQEKLQQATESLERIKADCKARLVALQTRLEAATYGGQRTEFQCEFDQLKTVFEKAIDQAEINPTKLEAKFLVIKADRDAKDAAQRKAQEEQIKSDALKQFILAGGDPQRFENAWSSIRHTVLNARVIDALINQKPKPQTVH